MNLEINCTYGNLGLLLLFLCNLGLIHCYFIRFCGSLLVRCCFPTLKAKQGRWLCAVSTHKSLPHQRNARWFTMRAPNPFSVFVNDGYCLAILQFAVRSPTWRPKLGGYITASFDTVLHITNDDGIKEGFQQGSSREFCVEQSRRYMSFWKQYRQIISLNCFMLDVDAGRLNLLPWFVVESSMPSNNLLKETLM